MKQQIKNLKLWWMGVTLASISLGGCEEVELPEPINTKHYDVTELEITFNNNNQPSYISFLAVKQGGSECTTGEQSLFEYEANIDNYLSNYESHSFAAFDFVDNSFTPRGNYGAGHISGRIAMQTNSLEGVYGFDFRDCAVSPDAMVLYMDNALIITNGYDAHDAEWLLDILDESGEHNIGWGSAAYVQGDFTP